MSKFRQIVTTIRGKLITKRIHAYRRWAEKQIKANNELWTGLQEYLTKSTSTGAEFGDYYELYTFVKEHKPKEILECGTGVTTIVMAQALLENERETGVKGRITSMEDKEQWFKVANDLLPEKYSKYIEIVLSPLVEDGWSIYRGIRYKELPERQYEFVFVDGPDFESLKDGMLTFDFDLIRVVEKSNTPVYAIVDDRLSSSYVYQKVFGVDKVRYSPKHRLSFIGPCCKQDLLTMEIQKKCFIDSFRLFTPTVLKLKLHMAKK